MPFVERVQEAEHRYAASTPVTGNEPLPQVRGLAFEHVSFEYAPGRPVLSDVSFAVSGGETIGVVGPSGAGKSTLVQLLLQLRDPQDGRYLVNGLSADQFASVADNIRYFRPLSEAAVTQAAEHARIDVDIRSWPNGYETIIGPRADAISGGQQQRICIARALAGRPELLVLDEPTSALDPASESLLQESLVGLKAQLTLFVIAHRMSTLDICDRVMVIVDGELKAFDTAARLVHDNAYYRTASALSSGSVNMQPS
jgi:ABC-type multidrug transport system fused ATPase/permease subunit